MGVSLAGITLADYAQMDAEWFYEVQAVQTAFRQGQQARTQADVRKRELAAG